MNELAALTPWLVAMVVLMAFSGFFSASEAALFYLRPRQLRGMESGTTAERSATELLKQPDRLLSAILFWNLLINVVYFSISSICSIRIERIPQLGQTGAILFAVASLLAIIFFSEMLPKSMAVLKPRPVATLLSVPLAIAVKLVDPLMPMLQWVYIISRRIIWPGFKEEAWLELDDLQRVIEHSGSDPALINQEQSVLQNIVDMSDIRVDEFMRPRTQFVTYHPPVMLKDLQHLPPSGYILVAEPDSAEIAKAIRLDNQFDLPETDVDRHAEPVLYLPWCSTAADAFEKMSHRQREVTVVVNEFGDTIGILTIEDVLDAVFSNYPSRSRRLLEGDPVQQIDENLWHVAGMVNLRRLEKTLDVELPETSCVTLGGVVHETLQKLAEPGDQCRWGRLKIKVLETKGRANLLIEVRLGDPQEDDE